MKYSQEALDQGLALIRPLWMLEPHDPACHTVDDEFSVGEELIVAPVLEKGVTLREGWSIIISINIPKTITIALTKLRYFFLALFNKSYLLIS